MYVATVYYFDEHMNYMFCASRLFPSKNHTAVSRFIQERPDPDPLGVIPTYACAVSPEFDPVLLKVSK